MDESAQLYAPWPLTTVRYCLIQGLDTFGGDGNIGDLAEHDPLFVDADGPDDIPGTPDDDLRLSCGSVCIDAGDNTGVPQDARDLDGDGNTDERTPLDLDGNPRFVDTPWLEDAGNPDPPEYVLIVDTGAYEFQLCACGDADGDGEVNLGDFATFVRCFGLAGPSEQCGAAEHYCSDLDRDGEITLSDFTTFVGLFGQAASGAPPECGP